MARCGCAGSSSCSCVVQGGNGISVSGSGTGPDPYVIDSTATSITGTLTVTDTATVDLTLSGSGSITDPYNLSADAALSVAELTDVATGAPATGDTLLWNGEEWVYGPPSSGGGGAVVTTTAPISGDGSVASPLGLATSGTWGSSPLDVYGTNTLLGSPIFLDTNGQVRSQPRGADVLASGAARPNQYPGRLIVQDGVLWFSDGTAWRPLSPTSEGPLLIQSNQWAASGITLGDGVTARGATSIIVFWRYGPIISFYCNGVNFMPSSGGTTGDIANTVMFTYPASMAARYNMHGSYSGAAGRFINVMTTAERSVYAVATVPTSTSTSSSAGWGSPLEVSFGGSWQLAADLDPEQALAPIRANAVAAELVDPLMAAAPNSNAGGA